MSTHQEVFEDIQKQTKEEVDKYLKAQTQSMGSNFGRLINFTAMMIATQTQELTYLREFEALCREAAQLSDGAIYANRGAEIQVRLDQILAKLTLFREELARQNTPQDATT